MSAHSAKPDDLIEAYVTDVMKRLPARQRNDVGFELRALLGEELRGRAADAGREADAAMTLDLLRSFGQPDEVAQRYHPPGVPIIPPQQTRAFAWTAFIGIGLQWAVSIPAMIKAAEGQTYSWIGVWWTSYGIGAFWWPGFLVTVMMVAAFVRQRWPADGNAWNPKLVDRDHVSRPLFMAGLGAALAGIGLWVALAWWATTTDASSALAQVFAFDADFLATRAPVVLIYWTAGIALLVVLIVEGRWRKLTRRIDLALKLASIAMLSWIVLGGRVFVAESTNAPTEGILSLLILVLVADAAWTLWRGRSRIRTPGEAAPRGG